MEHVVHFVLTSGENDESWTNNVTLNLRQFGATWGNLPTTQHGRYPTNAPSSGHRERRATAAIRGWRAGRQRELNPPLSRPPASLNATAPPRIQI